MWVCTSPAEKPASTSTSKTSLSCVLVLVLVLVYAGFSSSVLTSCPEINRVIVENKANKEIEKSVFQVWSWTVFATVPVLDNLYRKTFGEAEKMLVASEEHHVSETGEWSQIDAASHWRWDRELPLRPLLISERRAANQTAPLWQPRKARSYLPSQTHLSAGERKVSLSPVMVATVQSNSRAALWMCDVDHGAGRWNTKKSEVILTILSCIH